MHRFAHIICMCECIRTCINKIEKIHDVRMDSMTCLYKYTFKHFLNALVMARVPLYPPLVIIYKGNFNLTMTSSKLL